MRIALLIMAVILVIGSVLSNIFLALGLWAEVRSDEKGITNKWYRPLTIGFYLLELITAIDFIVLLGILAIAVIIKFIY